MVIEILNRVLIILLIMSCLTTLRHAYYFIQTFFSSSEEEQIKYKVSKTSLLFLCVSIAYILSVLFTGVRILL